MPFHMAYDEVYHHEFQLQEFQYFVVIDFEATCDKVDGGVSLSKALFMHDKWLRERGVKHTSFTIVIWTDWDCRTMLESECRLKGIYKSPYIDRWINLKVSFHEIFGRVRCNLKEAVQLDGLTWEGIAHCSLDDARNTAQLLINLTRRGF
ncbi:hypothetical protein KFK09_006470 [Dendrobium nobile]|uniref:Exonuclease domain-containing protein n=1 Tax=Dendrobium nobile TaxID=94219 RepID=A0A8T3BTR5_DENNO|nr:hypothetical protein KFK09_006470 [Dendrobium nobile]